MRVKNNLYINPESQKKKSAGKYAKVPRCIDGSQSIIVERRKFVRNVFFDRGTPYGFRPQNLKDKVRIERIMRAIARLPNPTIRYDHQEEQ